METDAGWERDGWRKLNETLGLTALRIPEAYGGHGFGFGELGIVLEEMGRALLCAPYFATAVLATGAIMNAGTDAQKQALLPDIALGETIATLACAEDDGLWEAAATTLVATPSGSGYRLDGHKSFVLDGHTADPDRGAGTRARIDGGNRTVVLHGARRCRRVSSAAC